MAAAFAAFAFASACAGQPRGLADGTATSAALPAVAAAVEPAAVGSGATGTPRRLFDPRAIPALAQSAGEAPERGEVAPASWGARKSYLIPVLEVGAFNALLNLYDRAYYGCCDFDVTGSSIRRNLRRSWVVDSDSFTVNQLGHPYQGSMYHGFARASGLTYWEGIGYAFLGSVLWEIAGETTPPSRNDLISTTIGGSFLGEALFRMANLWLEQGHGPPLWREIAAAAISPPLGFNRLALGERFDAIFASNDPDYYSRLNVGVTSATQNRPGTSTGVKRNEAVIDFAIDYGLPGKNGYRYRRPFDYFSFQASASSAVGFESVFTHGLLAGTDYAIGRDYRGLWGLYGSYDYMAPQVFRMASSSASVGTTAEWRVSPSVAVRGSVLAGVGYATVSTIGGDVDERANHYGVAPQALASMHVIIGDRASLDVVAREYFVSRVSGGSRGGHDNVVRSEASFTWRVLREHGIAVKYQLSRRDARFPDLGERVQTRGTLGLFYTYLGRDRFALAD